jgi:hydroxypyruvate isomerase
MTQHQSDPTSEQSSSKLTRRGLMKGAAGAALAGAVAPLAGCESGSGASGGGFFIGSDSGGDSGGKAVTKNNIHQSVVHWCFNLSDDLKMNPKHGPMTEAELAGHAKKMGVNSVELVALEHFKMLQNNGMICAIAPNGMPGAPFVKGLNNLKYQDEVIKRTKESIDACAEYKFDNVIAFNGYKWIDAEDPKSGEIPRDEGARNVVAGLKKLAGYAEQKKVTVCLEMLNTRDHTHPMKGHPGYQGDDLDYCADIIMKVGSPRVKLLYDIYHVQIMNGDVIRRIHQYKDIIGHYHTAGNPDRCEIDDNQELNYVGIMKAIAATNYKGHVAQEFIPTWDDKIKALRYAVKLCDV